MTPPCGMAAQRLAEVRRRIPDNVLRLAYHAALPVVVDVGLLNLLRVNFFLDPPDVLPFEAEAALLLSPLCREIGQGLYEMPPEIRNVLLIGLQTSYGDKRIRQVALLLEQYSTPAWSTQPELEKAQQLTALSFVDSARATRWLESASADVETATVGREWHVAMRNRLRAQPQADEAPREVVKAKSKLKSKSQEVRLTAVWALAALAQLPGTDITPAGDALLDMVRHRADASAPDVKAAVTLLRTLGRPYADLADAMAPRSRDQMPRNTMREAARQMAAVRLEQKMAADQSAGNLVSALAAIEEAIAIYRKLARSRPDILPDLARSLNDKSNRLVDLGRRNEALAAIEEAVAIYRKVARSRPDVRPNLASSRNDLARLLSSLDRTNEAVRLYQDLLPDQERVLGPDDPDTLATRQNIALWTGKSGQWAKALRLFRALLADQERVLGPDHPDTLATRGNIALSTGESGRPTEALGLLVELLPDRERVLGKDHPDTLVTRRNIAFWAGESGQPAEALRLYQKLLPDHERVFGPDHLNALAIRGNIAFWTSKCGQHGEALRLYRELLPDEVRVLGPDHHNTMATRQNIAILEGDDPETNFLH